MINVAVMGASGRTGRRVLAAVLNDPRFKLYGGFTHATSASLGADCGNLAGLGPCGILLKPISQGDFTKADLVIDFSLPDGLAQLLRSLTGRPLVTGTTGLTSEQEDALTDYALRAPVLTAANFSTGVTVLQHLVTQAARALPDYDIEIVEAHHRFKRDAPSGTALALGQAAASGRDIALREAAVHGRHGNALRTEGEIGFHAIRGGDVVGEHQVWIAGAGERVQLSHIASSRDTFAQGALRAGSWLAQQPPGRYSMANALGLTEA